MTINHSDTDNKLNSALHCLFIATTHIAPSTTSGSVTRPVHLFLPPIHIIASVTQKHPLSVTEVLVVADVDPPMSKTS